MRLIAYFAVIATFSLALQATLPAASAAEDAAASTPKQQSVADPLVSRVYHLKFVSNKDLGATIKPLLSTQGKVATPADHRDTIVVVDHAEVFNAIDHVVAQLDVQPPQVLIEATLVEVGSYKSSKPEAGSSILDQAAKAESVSKDLVLAGIPSTPEFIHSLEGLAEIKVIANPRMLALNKQPVQIHIGNREPGQTADQRRAKSSVTAGPSDDLGTSLRVRPYVSADKTTIRLEVHLECCTEEKSPTGIPGTYSSVVTANVLMPEGATIAIGGVKFTDAAPGTKDSPSAASTAKKEMLVIITPHLWTAKMSLNAELSYSGAMEKHDIEETPHVSYRAAAKP
jgi:type II secretory pathway component HofQ